MFFNWIKSFFIGTLLPLRGMGLFIRRPRCWSYLTIPVVINLALYGIGTWLIISYIWPWSVEWLPVHPSEWWNQLWSVPLKILTLILIVITGLVIFIFTFTMAFFAIAAPFLDNMTLFIEREYYESKFKIESKSHFVLYCWSSLLRSVKIWLMMLWWAVILLPLGWLVPALGMIPFVLVMSYYFALSFLVYSAEHYQLPNRKFRAFIKRKPLMIIG
jgi:uncharacterized protein involved in cysteine biosynthesis